MSSLRKPILSLTAHPWFRSAAIRSGIWRRFVAGEALDDGLAAAHALQRQGMAVMLDHLGENVATDEQARAATDAYAAAADARIEVFLCLFEHWPKFVKVLALGLGEYLAATIHLGYDAR